MAGDKHMRAVAASFAIIAVATLAVTLIISNKNQRDEMMEIIEVPVAPQLFRMPGSGYSGRATNEEDYTDPYGGGDRPGPYGYVNDPYDGDWALGPLGGKALYARAPIMRPEDRNIWDADSQGTNSIFMGKMSAKDAGLDQKAPQRTRNARPTKAQEVVQKHMKDDSFVPHEDWVGTNSVFFGSNGGGNGWARKQPKSKSHKKQNVMKAKMQTLFRSDDPHEAEYGREGDNQLDDSVLPSAIGTGGPVIGVDGLPSNDAHEWVHPDEPLDFACSPDILGCEGGLVVVNGQDTGF